MCGSYIMLVHVSSIYHITSNFTLQLFDGSIVRT